MFAIVDETKVFSMEQPPLADNSKEDQVVDSLDFRGGPTVSVAVLLSLFQAMKKMEPGQAVELKTDSFQGLHADIMAWGRLAGHEIHLPPGLPPQPKKSEEATKPEYNRYIIVKGIENPASNSPTPEEEHHLAIIISKPGLDELLSPLGFALAGACAGMKVSIYFMGPAVRVLQKNFRGRLPGLWAPFSGFARRGMDRMGHAPPAEKLNALQQLGATLYACHPSVGVFGVKERNLRDGVILAEYTTFLEVMKDADTVLYP